MVPERIKCLVILFRRGLGVIQSANPNSRAELPGSKHNLDIGCLRQIVLAMLGQLLELPVRDASHLNVYKSTAGRHARNNSLRVNKWYKRFSQCFIIFYAFSINFTANFSD